MRVLAILGLGAIAMAEIALGAEQVCINTGAMDIGAFLGVLMAVMAVLRPISAALGKIADTTENTWDNKLAKFLAKAIGQISWFTGLFTIGNVPKSAEKHKPGAKPAPKPAA